LTRRALVVAVAAVALLVAASTSAGADLTPNGTEYHPLTFPVREPVHYFDDFGGARRHPGNDLMGTKLEHELAATSCMSLAPNRSLPSWRREQPSRQSPKSSV